VAERGPKELFEQAAAAERRDPVLAASIYEKLASGSGPWAANALFAQGRLEADLGRDASARQTLTSYLARYPLGRNAADARALLARVR
jgi:TolA-binding protein